jgi:hypothetical protein
LKIAALALTAALLGLASVTPASAVSPSAVGHATAQTDGVTLVAKKVIVKKNVYKKNVYKKNAFRHRAGGRYKHAPNGWHRHDHRPGDWQTRGCIVVGPIWYCP